MTFQQLADRLKQLIDDNPPAERGARERREVLIEMAEQCLKCHARGLKAFPLDDSDWPKTNDPRVRDEQLAVFGMQIEAIVRAGADLKSFRRGMQLERLPPGSSPNLKWMAAQSFPPAEWKRDARATIAVLMALAGMAGERTPPKADIEHTIDMDAETRLIGVLSKHPEWSVTKIAKEAGTNRTTAYKCPTFVKARAALKAGKHGKYATGPSDRRRGRTGKHIGDTFGDASGDTDE